MNTLITFFFEICQRSVPIMVVTFLAMILTLLFDLLRVPKRIGYLVLVCTVLLRMVFPALPVTDISFFNMAHVRSTLQRETIPDDGGYIGDYEIALAGSAEYREAVSDGLKPETNTDLYMDYISYTLDETGTYQKPVTFREKHGALAALVWAAGVLLFWGYGIFSAVVLKRRIATATLLSPGVYETDQITAPFILGVFRPVIYLPVGLEDDAREMVLCHERMHLRWGDHIVKIIAYFAVGLFWFHLWIGVYFYRLFMALMEEACDQDVLRKLGPDKKADYSQALLNFSAKRQFGSVVTVAFGECWIKDRIVRILKYKKPHRILVVLATVVSVAAVLTLSTDGVKADDTLIGVQTYSEKEQALTERFEDAVAFPIYFSESVGSLALDLEVWTAQGLAQRQRILQVSDVHRLQNEQDTPVVWAFDTDSMDWQLSFREHEAQVSLKPMDFGFEDSVHLDRQLIENRTTLPVNESVVLYSLSMSEDTEHTTFSCRELSEAEPIPVPEGQAVVLLRLSVYHNRFPHGASLQDLINCNFSAMKYYTVSADGISMEVDAQSRSHLLELLMEYTCQQSYRLGITTLEDGQNLPRVRLSNRPEQEPYLEVIVCGADLYCYDCFDGVLYRLTGAHMDARLIAAEIYRLLGLNKTASEVYQLPQTADELVDGWCLLAGDARKDIWLYRNVISSEILVYGNQNLPVALGEGTQILEMGCADFSGDGIEELMLSSVKDGTAKLTVFELYSDQQPVHWITGQDLNYYMDTSFGEYLDCPDQFSLVPEWDDNTAFLFSGAEVLGEWADGRYVHDPSEPHYQDVLFYEEDGKLYVSATRVLHMKKDDKEARIPCARVTAVIDFQPVSQRDEPFLFHSVAISPLS